MVKKLKEVGDADIQNNFSTTVRSIVNATSTVRFSKIKLKGIQKVSAKCSEGKKWTIQLQQVSSWFPNLWAKFSEICQFDYNA